MTKDYYLILEITRTASAEEIKKAYRKKAKDTHPDRHGGDAEKEAEFKAINEAYAILSDATKRSRYDQFWSAEGGNFGGGFGGFDFGDIHVEDIFSSVFGNMGFGGGQKKSSRNEWWEDIQKEVRITFSESFSGIKKELSFDRMSSCEKCSGHGTVDGKEPKKCETCRGAGYVNRAARSIFGMMQQTVVCDGCDGTGVRIENPCKECHGTTRIKKNITQTVDIPAGIDDGMTLRITGEWHAGKAGPGDLYVVCSVDQSLENLVRSQHTLFANVKISPSEAILGANKKIRFPVLGEREIKISAGTQYGKKLQFTGDGMPVIWKKSHGDLIITLEILIPAKISKQEKKLYEEILEIEG